MAVAQNTAEADQAWRAEVEKQNYHDKVTEHYKEEYKEAARQQPGFLARMARRLDDTNKRWAKRLHLKNVDLSAVASTVAMFGGIAACAATLSILPFAAAFAALWAVNMPEIKVDSLAKKALRRDIDNGTLQQRYAREVTMGGQAFSRVEPPPVASMLAAMPSSALTKDFSAVAPPSAQVQAPPPPQPVAPPPRPGMTPF